jgi:hypothetical protein
MDREVPTKHRKELGEWAEMRFMVRASEEGLRAAKPYGESASYDFIVQHKRRLLRVQVKATRVKHYNSYKCRVRRNHRRAYTKADIDFIAAYVVPRDIWYIVPLEKTGTTTLILSPDLPTSKHAAYKEAWHLLRGD